MYIFLTSCSKFVNRKPVFPVSILIISRAWRHGKAVKTHGQLFQRTIKHSSLVKNKNLFFFFFFSAITISHNFISTIKLLFGVQKRLFKRYLKCL